MAQATVEKPETLQSIFRENKKSNQRITNKICDIIKRPFKSRGLVYQAPKRDSYHKINANGKNAELNTIKKIRANKNISVSTAKNDVTIYTNEHFSDIGKLRLINDAVIKSKSSNNSLFIEIKHQEVGGTVADKNYAIAARFNVLQKPLLIVCSGLYYTKAVINNFNKIIKLISPTNTTYMISIEDFSTFVEHWKDQDVTNFEEIKKHMEKPDTVYI